MQMKRVLHRLRFLRDHRWVPPHASEFLDDELGERERRRVEWHADDCPECRELLRNLRTLIAALGTMRDDDGRLVASGVLASVQSRLSKLPRDGSD